MDFQDYYRYLSNAPAFALRCSFSLRPYPTATPRYHSLPLYSQLHAPVWADLGAGKAGQQLVKKFGRTAATTFIGNLPTNKYDSLQTRIQRRFQGGHQIQFSYTWSHSLGQEWDRPPGLSVSQAKP